MNHFFNILLGAGVIYFFYQRNYVAAVAMLLWIVLRLQRHRLQQLRKDWPDHEIFGIGEEQLRSEDHDLR